MSLARIYLPMSTREAGYCVTHQEQKHLARKFGVGVEQVRERILSMVDTMVPQKSATKTKALIVAELTAAMPPASGRVS